MLEYKIEEKESISFIGRLQRFRGDTAYAEIPKFWGEHMSSPFVKAIRGKYGICMDTDGETFDYLIADDYIPCETIPEGCVTKTLPAGTWAVFPCRGKLPEALQDVNTRIWNEWLPSCKQYKLAGNYNVELYTPGPGDYSEIWVPVERV